MSIHIVMAAAVLLLVALGNLLLGGHALAGRDPEIAWRFGPGPLGVALVALGAVAVELELFPLDPPRLVTGAGALLATTGLARDGWRALGPGRLRQALFGMVALTAAPVAWVERAGQALLPGMERLSVPAALLRSLASGLVLAALIAQFILALRSKGEARRTAFRLSGAMALAELAASVVTLVGDWRVPVAFPDPVLGVALVVESATLVHLTTRGAPAPQIMLSRALAGSVVMLAAALAFAALLGHLGHPMPFFEVGVVLALTFLSAAFLLTVGDVLSRGVEQVLFPARARLHRELSGVRGEAAVLRARLERAERLARAGELAAAVAHEVKNPLAAVRGYAELLSDLAQPGATIDLERLAKAARIIRESSDRIDERVAALLRLGHPEPSSSSPRVAVALDRLVQDSVLVVEEEAREGGITLALGLPGVEVRAHPDALRGALVNLLRNAIEANVEARPIEVTTRRVGARIRVEIADRGSGLDPSIAGRLFEPFQTTKAQGTGLGLSIARSAVEAMGGTLALVGRTDGPGACAVVEVEAKVQVDGAAPAAEG